MVLGINSVEPTEEPLTAGSLRWVVLLRLRPSTVLVSAFVPAAASVLVLVGGADTLLI
jgi:predicted DNA repair protein MutK